jgi:hypothetical protein
MATLIDENQLEDMFDRDLDDMYEPYQIGYGKFYASDILKECDPIAYRLSKYEYAEHLAENADIYVEDYNDELMPVDEDEETKE